MSEVKKIATRESYGKALVELGGEHSNLVVLDADLADVDITLQFVEPQYLTEDPAGEIKYQGTTWSLMPYELWVAEQGEVSSHGR